MNRISSYLRINGLAARALCTALCLACLAGAANAMPQVSAAAQDTVTAAADSAAATGPQSIFLTGGRDVNVGMLVVKMLGYFSLIVVLIFGLVWFLKKFVYSRKELFGGQDMIKVISSTPVAPKKTLMIVEMLDRLVVLAVTDTSMNLVTELNREDYDDFVSGAVKSGPIVDRGQFGDLFGKILKRSK